MAALRRRPVRSTAAGKWALANREPRSKIVETAIDQISGLPFAPAQSSGDLVILEPFEVKFHGSAAIGCKAADYLFGERD
jgi:hypothetical protein